MMQGEFQYLNHFFETNLATLFDGLEKYNGAITAVATIFIAIFTIVLARVTGKQARLTTSIEARYVTIKWRDGNQSFTGHNEMTRVELVGPTIVKLK
jgi:hypothetical protein